MLMIRHELPFILVSILVVQAPSTLVFRRFSYFSSCKSSETFSPPDFTSHIPLLNHRSGLIWTSFWIKYLSSHANAVCQPSRKLILQVQLSSLLPIENARVSRSIYYNTQSTPWTPNICLLVCFNIRTTPLKSPLWSKEKPGDRLFNTRYRQTDHSRRLTWLALVRLRSSSSNTSLNLVGWWCLGTDSHPGP